MNFAGGFIAEELETPNLYVLGEYHAGQNRTVGDNVMQLMLAGRQGEWSRGVPIASGWGGSHQEEGWRDAVRRCGVAINEPPVNDVEVQISCVYAELASRNLQIFRDCVGIIGQMQTYSRELGPDNQPTEMIANKAAYHHLDWLRYVVAGLRPPRRKRVLEIT